MPQVIQVVDAFTDTAFSGNPAAVCVLDEPADEAWMQKLATELNLSETAFVVPNGALFDLRWFTPVGEVDLCGHATLATAHILWQTGILDSGREARFDTLSGRLTATRADGWITLDFPAEPPAPAEPPEALAGAIGAGQRWCGRNRMDYLVEVGGEDVVRGLEPDFSRLAEVDARGIIVTSLASTPGVDFVSRFFAPRHGINEDPVTGSAHCALAPFWAGRLGRATLTALQVSPRGGRLTVTAAQERVLIAGQAVTVWRGELVD